MFSKPSKTNTAIPPQCLPPGFIQPKPDTPLSLGVTKWPSKQPVRYPRPNQDMEPLPGLNGMGVSTLTAPANQEELAFLYQNVDHLRHRTMPDMLPLPSKGDFGDDLTRSVRFHCDTMERFQRYLREERTNPTRAEVPGNNAGLHAVSSMTDMVNSIKCLGDFVADKNTLMTTTYLLSGKPYKATRKIWPKTKPRLRTLLDSRRS